MTANVRIEWAVLSTIDNTSVLSSLKTAEYVTCNTTVQGNSSATTNTTVASGGILTAKVTATDTAIYVGVGDSSNSVSNTGNNGILIANTNSRTFRVANGEFVYSIQVP